MVLVVFVKFMLKDFVILFNIYKCMGRGREFMFILLVNYIFDFICF